MRLTKKQKALICVIDGYASFVITARVKHNTQGNSSDFPCIKLVSENMLLIRCDCGVQEIFLYIIWDIYL